MTRFLQFVLLGLAAGAAWAWSRHRQRNRDSATTASPLAILPGNVKTKPVEPPDAVGIPVAEAATSPVNLQPDAPNSEAFVREPEKSAPPPIVNPTKSEVRQEISTPFRPTKIVKLEGASHAPPERRSGGQMETEEGAQPIEQRKRTRSGPQLRLVCFKDKDRMWQLAVELPEDVSAASVRVSQDSNELQRTRFDENRWSLNQLPVVVKAVETRNGEQHWQLEIGDAEWLLFKLLKESETGEGRRVSAATRGDYLLITPGGWCISPCSDIEPRQERNIGVAGRAGYRFSVLDGVLPRLEFHLRDGQQVPIPFRTPRFTLSGQPADAEFGKHEAPLFLQSPPSVRALDSNSWPHVEKLVLRVAGEGHDNLVACFKPMPVNNETDLTEHLKTTKGGWYVVRLYDANEVLVDDGLYFAFSRLLRDIRFRARRLYRLPPATERRESNSSMRPSRL